MNMARAVDPIYYPAYASYYQALGAPEFTADGYWVMPPYVAVVDSMGTSLVFSVWSPEPFSAPPRTINGFTTSFSTGWNLDWYESWQWDVGGPGANKTLHYEGGMGSSGEVEEGIVDPSGVVFVQDITYNSFGQARILSFSIKIPTKILVAAPLPPTATITADSVTMTVGDTTIIRAQYAGHVADPIQQTNIESPAGTGLPGLNPNDPTDKNYTFTPTAPGSYTFYARINTLSYPWDTYAQVTVLVNKASPTVSFPGIADTYVGQSVGLGASVVGGHNPAGGVSYSIIATTGGAGGSIAGSTVNVNALGSGNPGTITLRATFAGDSNNTSSYADQTVNVPNRTNTQNWFTFNGVSGDVSITVGQTVSLSANATDPDGNLIYQTILWDQGNGSYWTGVPYLWNFQNSTGWSNYSNPTGYGIGSGSNSTITADWTGYAPGDYVFYQITWDDGWNTASGMTRTIHVGKASPSLNFAPIGILYVGQSIGLNATLSGGSSPTGGISYSIIGSTGGASGSVSGSTLNVTGLSSGNPGTITVRATYPGDANNAGITADQVVAVPNRVPSNISMTATSVPFGTVPTFTARATDADGNLSKLHIVLASPGSSYTPAWEGYSPSGLPWQHIQSYNAPSGWDSTVSGSLPSAVAPGTYYLTTNSEDAQPSWQYNSGLVMATFTISKASPTVSFPGIADTYVGQTVGLGASVSGGYAPSGGVSYSIIGTGGGATGSITGSTLTVTGLGSGNPGTITVRATFAGDANNNSSYTDMNVSVPDRAPTGFFTIDGVGADKTITAGQTVTLTSTMTDPDGNLANHSFWWDLGNGTYWANPWIAWSVAANSTGWSSLSGAGWSVPSGYSDTISGNWTGYAAGTYHFHSAGGDGTIWSGCNLVGPDQLTITVLKASPTVTFNPIGSLYVGQSVGMSSTIVGGYGPTGAITYSIVATGGGGTGSLSGNTLTATGLASGTATITVRAAYSGDANNNSSYVDQTISIPDRPPVVANVIGPISVVVGQSGTYNYSVTDPDGDMVTMETYFSDPTLPFGGGNWWPNRVDFGATGASYSCSRVMTFNQTGVWQAAYRVADASGWYSYWTIGTSNWSNTLNITVVKASPTVSFPSIADTHVGQSSALSASTAGGYNPTGAITYSVVGTSGGATGSISGSTLSVSGLGSGNPGTITVRATYPGDANNNSSFYDQTVNVPNRAPVSAIAASTAALAVGDSVLFTVTGTDADSNMTSINLNVLSPAGHFKVDSGPYSYDGVTAANNGVASFTSRGSQSYSCTVTFTKPGVYQFFGSANDPISNSVSAPTTITVYPRIDAVSMSDYSGRLTASLASSSSIQFGDQVSYNVSVSHIGSVDVRDNGTLVQTVTAGSLSSPISITPIDGGIRTISFGPASGGGISGALQITQTGATALRITAPDGSIQTIAPTTTVSVAATGVYKVEAIWSGAGGPLVTNTIGFSGPIAQATLVDPGLPTASFNVSVRPRIDMYAIQKSIPDINPLTPSFSVDPTIPLGPFDDLLIPADITISWNDATGPITGSGIIAQVAPSGSKQLTITQAMLSGDGTMSYSMAGRLHQYYAAWSASGVAGGSASLLYSTDNISFSSVFSGSGTDSSGMLPVGYYKVQVSNAGGVTDSVVLNCTGDVQEPAITKSIQPLVRLDAISSNLAMGSVITSKNYIFGSTADIITASANVGYQFTRFTGDTLGATSLIDNVPGAATGSLNGLPMTRPRAILASFDYLTYNVSAGVQEAGVPSTGASVSVSGSPYTDYFGVNGYRFGTPISVSFTAGLTALGNPKYTLVNWSDNGVSKPATIPYVFTLNSGAATNHAITANINLITFPLSVTTTSTGSSVVRYWNQDGSFVDVSTTPTVTTNPVTGPYEADTTVTMTTSWPTVGVIPVVQGLSWSGAGVTTTLNPLVSNVVMSGVRSVLVTFVPKQAQSVSWAGAPAVAYVGTPLDLSAVTSTSGLPVTVTLDSGAGTYDPVSKQLTFTTAATSVVRIWQQGDNVFLPAEPLTVSLNVIAAVKLKVSDAIKTTVNKEGSPGENATQQIINMH